MFKRKIKYLPRRAGERYASALTNMNLSNKVYKHFGKIKLRDYIKDFIKLALKQNIPSSRKVLLTQIIDYIKSKIDNNQEINLSPRS